VTGVLESQVFRIDHHLGKETVKNLMALRFANHIFESVWNRHHIEHVQITAPESIGPRYPAGSQGPAEAKSILAPSHEWRRL
jgi:glucose-6-phosphate 1-dehydrogenase